MHRHERGGLGFVGSLVAYARLVRLPNLFTAPPDIVVGAALATAAGYAVSIRAVVGLGIASVCLYAAGTTFNDYFDADEDARLRPERPIPAGAVPRRNAFALGTGLLGGGVLIVLLAVGADGAAVAGCLALAIVLYDWVFKGTVAGFLFMGTTRGLNVLLGATAAVSPVVLPTWALAVPAVITIYIAAVTFLGESETGESDVLSVTLAMAGVGIATLGVIGLLAVLSPSVPMLALAAVLLVGFVAWTGTALRTAYADPSPTTIGPAVGTCVLALVVLNAAFAAAVAPQWSILVLAFLGPAIGLSRAFDVS